MASTASRSGFRGRCGRSWTSEEEFLAAYRAVAEAQPDYPAVQAAAGAVLATRCAELAGSTSGGAVGGRGRAGHATLLGDFKIDAATGAQVKHTTVLLRWHGDALQLAG